ncbi:MAG TPA: FliH/SctL family protein [Bryobacteraceae bacterium]|nr:FliH/SctL family protein [Bryobacteraceae bacterium]
MSSKVLPPDDPRPVGPVAWRPVASPRRQPAAPAAQIPAPDQAARLAEQEQECQRKVREARAAGMREGEAAGRSRAAAEVQPVIERLGRAIQDLAALRPRLRRQAEADTLQLALAIARRVLRRELAVDPEALHGLVLAALEKVEAREISRVRLHPSQSAAVSAWLRQAAAGQTIEVVADPACQPGAAVFETERGDLDASVETQLHEIERGLADCLRRQA